ncbi:MAG: GspH/FimT family pseudopilin [Tahibacter sp.]
MRTTETTQRVGHGGGVSTPARGFTMIELMITIAIAGIMLALAMPDFREFSVRNQVTQSTNELIVDLNLARAEAVKRGVRTRLEQVGSWTSGWKVTADTGNDGTFATTLKEHTAMPVGYGVKGTAAASPIEFGPSGTIANVGGVVPAAPTAVEFLVCRPDKNLVKARRITASLAGVVTSYRNNSTSALVCT